MAHNSSQDPDIVYTLTDEAPALATRSLLPIVQAFAQTIGLRIETRDISLAGRILAKFANAADDLEWLGSWAKTPQANIIKLPNISASIPQLKAAIQELQKKGLQVPDYPENPSSDHEKQIHATYAKVLGSAVNPVLREGNSDRRVAVSVKNFAKAHPHSMGVWSKDSKTHVASMKEGDFYASEQSLKISQDQTARIEFRNSQGQARVLKDKIQLKKGEVADCALMSAQKLRQYYHHELTQAREQGILVSLHLKATMMKVSDPVIFGHAVEIYFASVFEKYSQQLKEIGVDARLGLGDIFAKLEKLPSGAQQEIRQAFQNCLKTGPALAMVDSDKGITNLHVPSDVIIDASMPAALRASGQMWGPDSKLHDTKALIPDRCYAGVYQACIEDCKQNGALDPRIMGSVANVGLMAQKAEEYGSHDKTFVADQAGSIHLVDEKGQTLISHSVEPGDIWRMCLTRDAAIQDWIKLAVKRAQISNTPVIFWLDPKRAHDRELRKIVEAALSQLDTAQLQISILSPVEACQKTLARCRQGLDTISATGNVLRDYLTDLFPILELGTSAKMLSIVPLLQGGGLFETGAGGSAPKHVQQFLQENYLRWDSLGEFLALAVSFEDLAQKRNNKKIELLAETLDQANARILENNRSPARKVGELDNRGSHFYLALYWAEALAKQTKNPELQQTFGPLYAELSKHENAIVRELTQVQGQKVDVGGYYYLNEELLRKAMRPSESFNKIINSFVSA